MRRRRRLGFPVGRSRLCRRRFQPRDSRPHRDSRGYSEEAARPSSSSRGRRRTPGTPGTRTASTRGGTCRLAHPRLPVTGRRRAEAVRCASRCRLLEHLVDAPLEPGRVASLQGLGQRRAGDQDVIAAGRHLGEARAPGLAEPALHTVAGDGGAGAFRNGDPEPRLVLVVAREPVQNQEAGRNLAAVAVDGIEVPRAGQSVAALHSPPFPGAGQPQAESRLRPLARRRFRIIRPACVDIRARKPCLRFRLRTLGW